MCLCVDKTELWMGAQGAYFIYYLLLLLHQQLTGGDCACVSAAKKEIGGRAKKERERTACKPQV